MIIKETIIVEGIYDKNRLKETVDATIIATDGFDIFRNKKKLELIRKMAEKNGIIILTDSDQAGFRIRSYLKECIPADYIKHAYIPEVIGKEKRKEHPGKEGILGVEGFEPAILKECLLRAGCNIQEERDFMKGKILKKDLYDLGLNGKPDSKQLRIKLSQKLNLPSKMSTNALLQVLNQLYRLDELIEVLQDL